VLPGSSEREGSAKSCWEDDAGKEGQEILGPEAQADEAGCAVKDDECDSDAENEQNHDPNVEEFLQQQDTAVIYPEAPEEDQRQGTPEASGHDDSAGKEGQEILGPEAQADEAGCAVKDDECDSDAENELLINRRGKQ